MGLITNIMDISKYSGLFHDGSIIKITHESNELIFFIESAQVYQENVDIPLSEDHRIKGNLHVKRIKSILIDEQPFIGTFKQTYDYGGIFDLVIEKNFVEISIKWEDFPPKPRKEDFSVIQIQAEDIYWENIPNLPDN